MNRLDSRNSKAHILRFGALVLGSSLLFGLTACTGDVTPNPEKTQGAPVDVNEAPVNAPEALEKNPEFTAKFSRGFTPLSEENLAYGKDFLQKAFPESVPEGEEELYVFPTYKDFDKKALENLIDKFTADGWEVLPELLDTGFDNENSYSVKGVKGDLKLEILNNGEDMVVVTISEMIPND